MMHNTYLDWAATTVPDAEILTESVRVATEFFANPSSIHRAGISAARFLDEARIRCARSLGCSQDSIIFTSGGSESNAIALHGLLRKRTKGQVLLSGIEHASVYEQAKVFATLGYR